MARFSLFTPVFLLFSSLFLLISLGSPSVSCSSPIFSPSLLHLEVTRSIDIRSHVEEITSTIKVQNDGTEPVSYYFMAIQPEKVAHLSFVEGSRGSGRHESKFLTERVTNVKGLNSPADAAIFKIDFPQPLKPGSSLTFTVISSFTRTLRPFPESIKQEDPQLVVYEDNMLFYSPYPTLKQSTSVKLASSHVESFTKKHGSHHADEIEYGPFNEKILPFAVEPMKIHYENNSPFATATTMIKEIEVSHWGNVAVTETYDLLHTGAKLSGPFSRVDYQRQNNYAPAAFRSLNAVLPHHASGIYYRDVIGNVSTSHVRKTRDSTQMEVFPRYPMFGGWTADFHIGYNLPAHHYLSVNSNDASEYVLTIPFGTMFQNLAIDEAVIRVILPEGSHDIVYSTQFEVDSEAMDVHLTHLDTHGRPVLVLKKANLVKHHNQLFHVSYRFSKLAILHEPILLIAVFALFFLLWMIYFRMDFGFGDNEKPKNA